MKPSTLSSFAEAVWPWCRPRACAIMKKNGSERGGALIEFIIVLIPLLVLTFGSIEFGVAGYNKAMLTNASREGARAGIVFDPAQPDDRLSNEDIIQTVRDYCAANLITFGDAAQPDVVINRAGNEPGDNLTVSVTYVYGFLVIDNLIPAFNPTMTLGAQTVMRME